VLGEEEDEAGGEAEAHELFEKLGVAQKDLVHGSYIDLLNGK